VTAPPPAPRLIVTAAPERPDGIVVVLHGGREHGRAPVRLNQLAVLRMVPIARRIAAAGQGRLAVVRVLDAVRGWNGVDASPVADARWAVGQTQERFGDLPVALVGHSMGGRAAMRAADAPNVHAVVGLAPWLPAGEPTEQLRTRQVLIVHGTGDRMTDPNRSAAFAAALDGVAAQVSYVQVPGEKHAMLRRRDAFDGLAAGFVTGTLLGPQSARIGRRTETAPLTNILRQSLAGERWLVA
jgi:alpha-beta hydrolase superfamily lysophospholipase